MSGPPARSGVPREQIDALFAQALDLEGAQRLAWLDRITADNDALRAELDDLLQRAETPIPLLDPQALASSPLWQALARDIGERAQPEADLPVVDTLIGGWRLLHPIGRGGMGEVHLAERSGGEFEQRGALKLIRSGVDSGDFLRRFAQERQILASLDHPGIARLLDGGRDAQGRPYLVMEYVEGEALDVYCDGHRLDIRQRLALFADIGRVVAHAHRHLIVHRDLKPSNVVVNAEGEAKLLDFGIAKVLVADGATPLTRTVAQVFTPEYAAPEQIRGEAVSTGTDVYQLGLLLYELLSGRRAQALDDSAPASLQRVICDTAPAGPSQRVDDDRDIATARNTTPAALRRQLRGDLDNIVLKALRKAPERRYGSAMELVEDIERWQRGLPIRARPEQFGYRSGKFLRRHPLGVATACAGLALLIAYAVTVTRQSTAIARERDRAQAEAVRARQVQSLVLRLFAGADPERSGGAQLSARELLDRGWAEIAASLPAQADTRVELLDTVGEAYRQLGSYERAQPLFEQSLRSARSVAATQPLLLARALRSLGRLRSDQGDYAQSKTLLQEALARDRAISPAPAPAIADDLSDLGRVHFRQGEYADAETLYREALTLRRRLYGGANADVADSLNDLGVALRQQSDYAGAEPLLAEALALRRRLLPATHPQLARSLSDLALVRSNLGDDAAAEALYREALAVTIRARGAEHPYVATMSNNLAQSLAARRHYPAALALLRQALAIRRKSLGEHHPEVALNYNDLGRVLADSGDLAGAQAAYAQALAIYAPDHPWRAATVFNLGQLAEKSGRWQIAETHYRDALAQQRRQYGDTHERVATDRYRLGVVLQRQGRLDEAETEMRQALAVYRERLPARHPKLAPPLLSLGALLLDRDRAAEAEPLLREALRIAETAGTGDEQGSIEAARLLARARHDMETAR